METPKIDLFLGVVSEVLDENRTNYKIKVDIPGVAEGWTAYPLGRGELDEPVVGNSVIIMSVDPLYHSVNFYSKLKENDFIGFRSNGKMVDITPDAITIGVYDSGITNKDSGTESVRPDCSISSIMMDNEGNIVIKSSKDITLEVTGNNGINIEGESNLSVSGNSSISVSGSGSCIIDSPDVKITGASLTINGTAAPTDSGPFCGIPACLLTGAPHVGNISSGN